MENTLPKGWVETNVKIVSEIIRGVSYKKEQAFSYNFDDSVYVLRGGNIQDNKIDFDTDDNVYVGKQLVNSIQLIKENDVVIVGSTGSKKLIGKAGIATYDLENVSFGAFLMLLRTKYINKKYHSYFFQTKYYRNSISELAGGVNINNIRKEYLENLVFPLPPLPEQERIVAKLDKLFAQHEKIKKALDRIPQLLKAFRQQVLTQAVTGKLTEQWREGRELEDFDQLVSRIISNRNEEYQKSIALAQQKGERKPSKPFLFEKPTIDEIQIKLPQTWGQTNIHFLAYVTKLAGFEYTNHFKVTENGGIPIVRAQNVQMGKFEDKNRLYISKEVSDFLVRSQLHGRELLMVFIGAGTGNVCLAPDNERWHLAPNVAKIDFDFVDRKYMFYYLQSDLGVKNVLSRVKATAQPSLSMETIREIVTIVPPIEEQQEIVRCVESLFAKADAIEERYQKLKKKIDTLPQAVLHKAFKGELVPQLPTDGDAKDLLAEIMALKKEVKRSKKK